MFCLKKSFKFLAFMITITWLLFLGGSFPSAHESNTVTNKFLAEDRTHNRDLELVYKDRFMHLFDLDGNGHVTLAEIAKDRELLFSAIDIDGDQTLSATEMRRRGRALEIFRASSIFDMLDINGDGKLSLHELQEPTRRWFSRYDKNQDGNLELQELPERKYRRRAPRQQ